MLPEGAPTLSSLSDFNRDFFSLDSASLATLIHIGNCKSRQCRQHGKSDEHFCHTAATVAEAITMSEIENQFNYENYG
jgi:hypothetical protein